MNAGYFFLLSNARYTWFHGGVAEKLYAVSASLWLIAISGFVIWVCLHRLADWGHWTRRPRYWQAVLWGLGSTVPLCGVLMLVQAMRGYEKAEAGLMPELLVVRSVMTKVDPQASQEVRSQFLLRLKGERVERLSNLREKLLQYALAHDGHYPETIQSSGFDVALWELPASLGGTYAYVEKRIYETSEEMLVVEPDLGAGSRWGITVGGELKEVLSQESAL